MDGARTRQQPNQQQPPPPASGPLTQYNYPQQQQPVDFRERFWNTTNQPDPWAHHHHHHYAPPPHPIDLPFASSSPSSGYNSIPSNSPYNNTQSASSSSSSEMSFPGPSPPNPVQPVLSSPYPPPPTSISPRRNYTTPSPHIPTNGLNGNSNSSGHSPGQFESYLNNEKNNHPNEHPGYQVPRQQQTPTATARYPGDKGEPEYYNNQYYNYNYQEYVRRPLEPYSYYEYGEEDKKEEKQNLLSLDNNQFEQKSTEEPNNNKNSFLTEPHPQSSADKPEGGQQPKSSPKPKKKRKKKKEERKEETKESKVEQQEQQQQESEEDDEDNSKKKDVPMVECGCFPADEVHAEPGPFYTQLGAAHSLAELREGVEQRTGFRGGQLRFEKVIYTGKEGKTSHGCPLAKWILRRSSYEEQLLFLVKHRKGHKCSTAWIVICCVIWEGVPPHFSDNIYDTLVYKLNRFGIPTTRRSDTNEQRSCACQGVDPDVCGAAYSFGCAWSMFFNGCKYARSRNVRKFRLTEEHEESEMEEKLQHLATHLGPLYERVAPDSFRNQIDHENEGLECRLGYRPGRPFSGVTVCMDYCSHAHKDAHNMTNGCTVTVSFTRNRALAKSDDEQYHVFPLYKLDETDEFGSKDGQKAKVKKGQLEILKKFPCKVRIRKVPLLPSRRRGKTNKSPSNAPKTPVVETPPPPPPKPTDSPPIKKEKFENEPESRFYPTESSTWSHFNNQPNNQRYFESFVTTTSQPASSSSSSGFGSGSSLSSLTELTNSSPTRSSNPASIPPNGSPRDVPSSGSSSGYTSMSPILPSFRHTFMTEGETDSRNNAPQPPPPMQRSFNSQEYYYNNNTTTAPIYQLQPSTPFPNYQPNYPAPEFPPMNPWNPVPPPYSSNYPYPYQSLAMGPHQYSHHHHHHHHQQYTPMFHHAPHHPPPPPPPNPMINQPSCFVTPPKPKVIPEVNESFSDNEEAFKDSQIGGVAIALTHGSVVLQCAKHELHATTALKNPNRMYPSRICLIFYQHKSMNNRFHGWSEWEKKIEAKKLQEVKLINQGKMEASPRKMKQLIKEGYLQDQV